MLKQTHLAGAMKPLQARHGRALMAAVLVVAAVGLAGCGKKEAKPGQSLASVDGEEITQLQLNEELQRAGVQGAQQEAASKQLLESLIERQLLLNAAVKDKVDRDPKVVQAMERAKALILAQAYLQKHVPAMAKPARAEIDAYYAEHPLFFSARKQFDMRELVLASKDLDDTAKGVIDAAKSLEEVASWLEQRKIKFARTQLSRTSADLPPELSGKLQAMAKGQLFIIKEGERSLLLTITDIKDSPVTLEAAAPQIEQFLMNKKGKDSASAELARLRSAAKVSYLNGASAPAKPAAPAPAAAAAPAASGDDQAARGVAGLK